MKNTYLDIIENQINALVNKLQKSVNNGGMIDGQEERQLLDALNQYHKTVLNRMIQEKYGKK